MDTEIPAEATAEHLAPLAVSDRTAVQIAYLIGLAKAINHYYADLETAIAEEVAEYWADHDETGTKAGEAELVTAIRAVWAGGNGKPVD